MAWATLWGNLFTNHLLNCSTTAQLLDNCSTAPQLLNYSTTAQLLHNCSTAPQLLNCSTTAQLLPTSLPEKYDVH
jgi:hypothetical protein